MGGDVASEFAELDRAVSGLAHLGLPVVTVREIVKGLKVAADQGVVAGIHARRSGEHGDDVDGQVEHPEFLGGELMQVLFELIEPTTRIPDPDPGRGHRPGETADRLVGLRRGLEVLLDDRVVRQQVKRRDRQIDKRRRNAVIQAIGHQTTIAHAGIIAIRRRRGSELCPRVA